MIYIDNPRTSIAQRLIEVLRINEDVTENPGKDCIADRVLLCRGHLEGESMATITKTALKQTMEQNFIGIAQQCERILSNNPKARICIIGSESGYEGSFDMAYAGAKAALHLYVEKKSLYHREQQLVCVAPTIIEDSGMTQRRVDLEDCMARGEDRRRGRWLIASEVARIVHFALYEDTGALCNTVIRVNGGNW